MTQSTDVPWKCPHRPTEPRRSVHRNKLRFIPAKYVPVMVLAVLLPMAPLYAQPIPPDPDQEKMVNKSLYFPNTAQYTGGNRATANTPSAGMNLTGDWTIEYWIKAEGEYYWHLFGKNRFGDNSKGWLIKKPSTEYVLAWTYNSNQYVVGSPVYNQWQHIAMTYEESAQRFRRFVDGKLVQDETRAIDVKPSEYPFVIGHEYGTGNWFRGKLDNLRLSDTVRYAAEFIPAKLFPNDDRTIAFYTFDRLADGVLLDYSGNGNDLTPEGVELSDDVPFQYPSSVAQPTLDMTLSIRNEAGLTQSLRFGTHPEAGEGFDLDLDRFAPPAPPSGVFDVRLRRAGEDYLSEFTADSTDRVVWDLRIAHGTSGTPVTLTWNPDAFALPGTLRLTDAVTGNLVTADMAVDSSLTLDNAAIEAFQITYSKTVSVDVSLREGWNLVGLPVQAPHTSFTELFAGAMAGTLFGFESVYVSADTLANGSGYWIRMAQAGRDTLTGAPVDRLEVPLAAGWNLISGPSHAVPADAIQDDGEILLGGTLYRFDGTYQSADTLRPGSGYWIRAQQDGSIVLDAALAQNKAPESGTASMDPMQAALEPFTQIVFEHARGSERVRSLPLRFAAELPSALEESDFPLPPLAPAPALDARFTLQGRDAGKVSESEQVGIAIVRPEGWKTTLKIHEPNREVASETGPVASDQGQWLYHVVQRRSGEIMGETTIAGGEGLEIASSVEFVEVERLQSTQLDLPNTAPHAFELEANYPNPFNPSTKISFTLARPGPAILEVYNVTGEKVATLVSHPLPAGRHSVEFEASHLSSGVYVYRLRSGSHVASRAMVLLR